LILRFGDNMDSKSIRNNFTRFFESHQHKKISSSPLVPQNDPTLLFANAGMNQFKDIFTGKSQPEHKRAVTIQKVVRAGGKHNDLENVGFTTRHHTFFEMLGNFSFGDYFKKEAIEMAWKLLTDVYKIPENKLLVTVHYTDMEALEIWNKHIGLPLDRIFKKGDKENFWEMGDVGPCGPCSEIFYDYGPSYATPNFKPGAGQDILDDELRYIEIWNLVFMQFEKTGKETLKLPKPSIDTGAGLERVATALQGKYWNYDTDLFLPIINKVEALCGKKYSDPKSAGSMRVIADHIRSSTMLITDGVIPSNEGRGYVLRRIIRRAVRHLRELGFKEISFYKLVPTVFEILGDEYPENKVNFSLAEKLLKLEEEKFLETLDHGMKYLEESLRNDVKDKTLSGKSAFKLYDTFGFPLDLTEVILREKGLKLNQAEYDFSMNEAKEKSKKSWKSVSAVDQTIFYKVQEKVGDTKFLGYEKLEADATLLAVEKVEDVSLLVFDQSPFYAEGGGQAGDRGEILLKGKLVAKVLDTKKPTGNTFFHLSESTENLKVGDKYTLRVNAKERSQTASNHSATHLLQAALINILGNHIKQSGSEVNDQKLRFDFTHMKAMSASEIEAVENAVNAQIEKSLEVKVLNLTKDQAMSKGALALFGEKYGDQVRVLEMGDYSIELCGGTHVTNVSQIGSFVITSESALSSGVRRIEALTGSHAFNYLKERSKHLREIELSTSLKGEAAVSRVNDYLVEIKTLKKEIENLQEKIQIEKSKALFSAAKIIGNTNYLHFVSTEPLNLKIISEQFVDKNKAAVAFLVSTDKDKATIVLKCSPGIKLDCSTILKTSFPLINGKGGGKPDMAQGSGENNSSMSQFIGNIEKLILEKLS
jgi:alanyl-tRNA synthetase